MPVTLLDVAKATGSDGIAGLVEEVVPAVPEIGLIPTKPHKGTLYTASIRTGIPKGGFRAANQGTVVVNSQFEQKQFACHIVNPVWICDKAVADAHMDGADAFIAAEAYALTLGAFMGVASQIYYGTGNDAVGFPGLQALYDAANMTIDAGGTTANTGSSVWFLKLGPMGVQLGMGNDSQLSISDVKTIVTTDAQGRYYSAYHQELQAWVGLHHASKNSSLRIRNLTEDAGKGLTDAWLGKALAKFPVGFQPDVILMSRRSREQLRSSRTATTVTGAEAPLPDSFQGIPIVATDSILNTESLT